MSEFEVKVEKIFIKEHPNADALEIGNIGDPEGFQVVVKKGLFKAGDLVAYIPENAVVPEWVLKQYGYWNEEKNKGLLAGTKGDRVKMVKLRDATSLGICIPVKVDIVLGFVIELQPGTKMLSVSEGQNVADALGIEKYIQPIPIHMAGQVFNAGQDVGVNYDIEDLAKYPHVLIEGEEVQITAKLHGTNCSITALVNNKKTCKRDKIEEWTQVSHGSYVAVGSKGQSALGLFFKDNEENAGNLYLNGTRKYHNAIGNFIKELDAYECMTVVGEVFGGSVQSGFDYGLKVPEFRVFDVYLGYRGQGRWLDDEDLDYFCERTGIPRVPLVYRGPYSKELAIQLANAPEDGLVNVKHVREGVVIKPIKERRDPDLGRVVVKTRSIAYMTRKGDHTDYN